MYFCIRFVYTSVPIKHCNVGRPSYRPRFRHDSSVPSTTGFGSESATLAAVGRLLCVYCSLLLLASVIFSICINGYSNLDTKIKNYQARIVVHITQVSLKFEQIDYHLIRQSIQDEYYAVSNVRTSLSPCLELCGKTPAPAPAVETLA